MNPKSLWKTGPAQRPRRFSSRFLLGVMSVPVPVCVAAVAGVPMDSMPARYTLAIVIALAYLAFCAETARKYRRDRRAQEALWAADTPDVLSATVAHGGLKEGMRDHNALLIAFASQTGFAEQLALRTAQSMRGGGLAIRVSPLARVDARQLATVGRALFIVSTTGEGDAPDSAAGFARRMAESVSDTPGAHGDLRFGILALGDRSYTRYCAFGHALERWLRRHRAQPLFDTIEVDNGDEGALRHWQHHLGVLSGRTETADWTTPRYGRWRLTERRLLNPGSVGGPVFHLSLAPLASVAPSASLAAHAQPDPAAPVWQAGDIAEVGPCNAPADIQRLLIALGIDGSRSVRSAADGGDAPLAELLATRLLPHEAQGIDALRGLAPEQLLAQLRPMPHREYSIASLPAQGTLDLLVRRVVHADGRPGLGSGWLTQHAGMGSEIALRIRGNRNFHPPLDDIPLILVGNGTGLAGLRAHMQARAHTGRMQNWLLFGERSRAADYLHREEIESWLAQGALQRLDLAFSRDQPQRIYVQDKLRAAADELVRWVDRGAAIYVCGSLLGMAGGVADALQDILGEDRMIALAEAGRYRRDVY